MKFLWDLYGASMECLSGFYAISVGFLWDCYGSSMISLDLFNLKNKSIDSKLNLIEILT